MGAFLHSVAAPALNNDVSRASARLSDAPFPALPELVNVERNFKRSTDSGYVDLLVSGLRSAGMR